MIPALINPDRFLKFSRWAMPLLGLLAAMLMGLGMSLGLTVPPDYQQGETVLIMFIHVPAAWISMFAYACLGVSSFLAVIFRLPLANLAARACAPIGAAFTVLALATGSLWGRPMWGAWWVWDGRLTSVLILLLFYLGYMALRSAIDDETKADRAAAILALAGVINLPVIHFSVEWWNTLHQGASVFRKGGSSLSPVYLLPLLTMSLGYMAAFGAMWLQWIRTEVWRARAQSAATRSLEA
jgi:heme exporter protein C